MGFIRAEDRAFIRRWDLSGGSHRHCLALAVVVVVAVLLWSRANIQQQQLERHKLELAESKVEVKFLTVGVTGTLCRLHDGQLILLAAAAAAT